MYNVNDFWVDMLFITINRNISRQFLFSYICYQTFKVHTFAFDTVSAEKYADLNTLYTGLTQRLKCVTVRTVYGLQLCSTRQLSIH
jgi:hypothetical protein